MKIRVGFVSNSSSSSFYMFGISLSERNLLELLEENGIDTEQIVDKMDIEEFLYERLSLYKAEIEIQTGNEYDDELYLGLEPTKMKDNETMLQFKQRIVDDLNKLKIGEFTINDIFPQSECWFDG